MPVYNERETIREIVERVTAVPIRKELIIVDDYSTDGTRIELAEIAERRDLGKITIVYHEKNQGKGAALRTGFQHISPDSDVVVVQDADLEYDPNDYPTLLKPIMEGKAEVVYGSRFLGPHRVFLFWHRVANWGLTLMTNILYDTILTDMETCYKAMRSEIIRDLPLRARRFDFEPEITAKILKRKYRVYEVPINYNGRDYEEGKKIGLKDAFEAVWALIRYRFSD